MNCLQLLNRTLKGLFHRLGYSIGTDPGQFIFITILTSLLVGTGVQRVTFVSNLEYLFSPQTGAAQRESQIVEQFFPVNYSARFDPSRFIRPGRITRVFLTAKDGGNLLRSSVWREMQQVDELLKNVRVEDGELEFQYKNLCARWGDECFPWSVLKVGEIIGDVEAGNLSLNYPVTFIPATFETIFFPMSIGGYELSNVSTIKSIKAVQLIYFLDHQSPLKNLRGEKWEAALMAAMEKADEGWKLIKVDPFTWGGMSDEVDSNNLSAIPYMLINVPIMVIFAALTCMSSDWVRSKPWLGLAGVICPLLGCVAAFGALSYVGVPMCSIHVVTPFLMLGIGMDDSFVMLAAWRQTKVTDPVPKRLGQAFAEAGVSITITSLTNMLSLLVGLATPIPYVRLFSAYTGAAVVCTYLCHIFIFGGALALSGRHEEKNRHGLFFWVTCTPKSKLNSKKSWFHQKLWVGGIDPDDPKNPVNNHESRTMTFFRDTWAHYLNKPISKALVLVVFAIYLVVSCWGISMVREGLEMQRLARTGSYAGRFLETDLAYFRDLPYRLHVVITGDVDYSNTTVQNRIEKMMQQFEMSKYIGPDLTISWLRGFLSLVNRYKSVDLEVNVTTETEFIQSLLDNYLSPALPIADDLNFNKNYTKIVASRFIMQVIDVYSPQDEMEMVNELRAIAHAQGPELNVTVFNWYFPVLDGHLSIRNLTIQCVTVAGLIMMVVSIIFIPNLICSLWVAFSIISTEVGVLGFLVFWNVSLDAISMICLIMCIGFSVDFSAHISYAYLSAKASTPEERVKSCLYSLGWPVVQGAVSTVLGVGTLIFSTSYNHVTFLKAVFLVMTITAAHGLLLLPVLLSIFGPGSSCQRVARCRGKTVILTITPLEDKKEMVYK